MKVDSNQFPKVILEERLSDGSDTTTPAADHRSLFLGEDGLLHLKDSSAAVTSVGGYTPGGTDVAVADGGTGASTASGARTNLGLVIGTDVQAALTAASQAEMEAGTEAALRSMSPLRVAQAIAALAAGGGGGSMSTAQYRQNVKWGAAAPAAAAVTLPTAPTNGRKLIGVVIHDSPTTTTTAITQTNVTWTLLHRYAGTSQTIEVWIGAVAASAGTTATLTNSATGYNSLLVAEFSGIAGTLVDSISESRSGGGNDQVMPCLTPTGGDMVLCIIGFASGSALSRVPTGPLNRFYWPLLDNSFKGEVQWAGPYPVAPGYFDTVINSGYTYLAVSIT